MGGGFETVSYPFRKPLIQIQQKIESADAIAHKIAQDQAALSIWLTCREKGLE